MKGENMAREKGMGNLQREKSGRWTMRVGINGKRYCRSTRTKDRDQAERTLQRFLAPFGLGEHRLPLADVWNAYVVSPNRNELAPSTLNVKRIAWMHFAKWMKHNYLPVSGLADVTADMIAEYLAVLRADLCASSYNGRVCILREIFRTLATKAGLEENPWEGVRLRPDDSHSRRELTMDELQRLLAAAKVVDVSRSRIKGDLNIHSAPPPSTSTSEWYKLILIGIYTGLRLGDCCLLDWSQINLAQQVIQLIPQKTKRHAHGRPVTIPIHPALGQALLGNEAHPSSLIGPVLPAIAALYGRSRWQVSHEITSIFKAANIKTSVLLAGRKHRTPEATFHSLRHTFVSFAANAGVPLHIVQSIVGHSSTAMTRHYYHENIDALKSAVAAIPTL
jgi:integrase